MPKFGSIEAFLQFLATRPRAVEEAEKVGLEAAGRILVTDAQAMIGQENPEWPALAPSTVAEKERLGYTGQKSATDPLLRTWQLHNSISSEVSGHKLAFGSDDPVMGYQEFGTSRIPPRPVIGPTMLKDAGEAAELVANHVLGAAVGFSGPLVPAKRRAGDGGS